MSELHSAAPGLLLPPPVLLPQRDDSRPHWFDRIETAITGIPALALPRLRRAWLSRIVGMTNAHARAIGVASDRDLTQEAFELRRLLRTRGLRTALVARAFAVIREVAYRSVGHRHFDVQLVGGFALLNGMVAE